MTREANGGRRRSFTRFTCLSRFVPFISFSSVSSPSLSSSVRSSFTHLVTSFRHEWEE